MGHIYGDAVILVKKLGDGSLQRLNAIVLAAQTHVPLTADRKVVPDAPEMEHLDVAFPVPSLVPTGHTLKTRNMDEVFRPAYDVAPYSDGMWFGYEEVTPAEEAKVTEYEQALLKSSGDDNDAGDWTSVGMDADGFPVAKGSPSDTTYQSYVPKNPADGTVSPLPEEVIQKRTESDQLAQQEMPTPEETVPETSHQIQAAEDANKPNDVPAV